MRAEAPATLATLAEEIAQLVGRPRNALQVTVGQSEKSYLVQVLGAMRESRNLITTAPVMTPAKTSEKRADIHYYGVSFHGVSYEDQVLIHCYVQERLALESDWLTPLLVSELKAVEKLE